MMNPYKYCLIVLFIALFVCSCHHPKNKTNQQAGFEVQDFKTLTNWNVFSNESKTTKLLYLDYANAIFGFTIPSIRQTADGQFHFEFKLKNLGSTAQKFYYKIYYQNDSYKFPECGEDGRSEHPLASENFYGSWEDSSSTFVATPEIAADGNLHRVAFQLRIVGNPRNEQRCFYKTDNQRWRRNPRMGNYSFMLVVTTAENIQKKIIPDYIANIGLKNNNNFVNPFYYFMFGDGHSANDVGVTIATNALKVIAKPDLATGMYVNPQDFDPKTYSAYYKPKCAFSDKLYLDAPLGQFINNVTATTEFDNIPVIADVLGDNYSLRDYNWNRTFYKKEELIRVKSETSKCPCQQVAVDTVAGTVELRNPGSSFGDWKKQSVGVITRHGLTYGIYTVKLKLTELLNQHGVWNGVTNAIWLVTNGTDPWNNCRECTNEGYLPKYGGGKDEKRSAVTPYSEIDFEILKTVDYCPSYAFPPAYGSPVANRYSNGQWNVPLPQVVQHDSDQVMVCCTNWDMACPQPRNYDVGCMPVNYGNTSFLAHRWDYWYKALTERTPVSDNEMFAAPYYYFQIEWKPTEIVWRLGPEKNQLRVVGYMNDQITSIPNNQMLLIISQEFHSTDWWHGSPFEQQFIPFPKNDLVGKIFEITVE
ncbi:MAG: hypothetical protein WCQ95_05300 [Bacteroidota bacterium]